MHSHPLSFALSFQFRQMQNLKAKLRGNHLVSLTFALDPSGTAQCSWFWHNPVDWPRCTWKVWKSLDEPALSFVFIPKPQNKRVVHSVGEERDHWETLAQQTQIWTQNWKDNWFDAAFNWARLWDFLQRLTLKKKFLLLLSLCLRARHSQTLDYIHQKADIHIHFSH